MRIYIICNLFFIFYMGYLCNTTAQDLPRDFSEVERATYRTYYGKINTNNARLETQSAPNFTPRAMAEWEEVQGVIITWSSYKGMLRDIVKALQNECKVYIVTTDSIQVKQNLTENNISLHNVKFIISGYNSVWVRDYGSNSVYANKVDSLVLVDWIYNRPRAKDDIVSLKVGQELGVSVFETTQYPNKLVHTGGNFMTDGFGTAFSSELVNTDNSTLAGYGVDKTSAEIDTVIKHFMGISRYIKMPVLPYDDIHHIDMHIKLLDEETLLIGKYPEGISDGPQIEANVLFIQQHYNSVYGTPYKIIRIPMPADAKGLYPASNGEYYTYTNSLIANKTVIVPTYNIPTDTIALAIYRNAMPGYSIVGINSIASIGSNGALHCITKEIGIANPLLISYKKLVDTQDTINSIKIEAFIKHTSGIKAAKLYYKTSTDSNFTFAGMTATRTDYFTAEIPNPGQGHTIQYYVQAEAYNGKVQVRPITGSGGALSFKILTVDMPTVSDSNTATGNNSSTTGVSIDSDKIVSIYPNPASNILFVDMKETTSEPIYIVFSDVYGKVYTSNLFNQYKSISFNVSDFPNGMYVMTIHCKNSAFTQKVIIKNQ